MISSETKICGLIGDPVTHSVSPVMHNAAFEALGLDYIYLPFNVAKDKLAQAVDGVGGLNIRGLNVTIPHKVAVIPFLGRLEPLAERIGAINTIINESGVLTGHNTDAAGFLKVLQENGIEPRDKKVVLLGAGGAARAIAFALAEKGTGLAILNRKQEMAWAVELASSVSSFSGRKVKALELNEQNLKAALVPADVVVNATSVGMSPNDGQSPVSRELLRQELVVFDIVYNPVKTRLLSEAEQAGAITVNGLDMLVWQGVLAFELWTGVKAPVKVMRDEVVRALGGGSSGWAAGDDKRKTTSVALVGFMGAGKTAIGRVLAKKMSKELVDMDSLIAEKAGKSIARIFDQDGEVAFRQLEMEVTRAVAGRKNQVIACGGGVVLNKINIDRLKAEAVVVYLAASPEAIQERIAAGNAEVRPLLVDGVKSLAIRELLAFRQPFYRRAADIIIDTSRISIEAVAEQIIARLKRE
jgi:shikimate dehydrogenase